MREIHDSIGKNSVVQELASQIAEDFSDSGKFKLDPTWINVQVRPIMKDQGYKVSDFQEVPGYKWSNLKLLFAKPGYLLAMKCQALREGTKDYRDVVNLLQFLGIRTIEQLREAVGPHTNWDYLGNDELPLLKLAIAWAYPGETEYDGYRQRALERYRQKK